METATDYLNRYWGYSGFRPLQEDIIGNVLEKQDVLTLLPTGGGKSLCFQVPGLMMPGVCLVITPLIALMKDQVEELKRRNIRAAAIYSGLSKTEIDYTLDNFVYGDYKFLYLSPERLLSDLVIERIKLMDVSLIAIDEAHCVSQWGHDFRPAYLRIPEIYEYVPNASKIALTATATSKVQVDIITHLQLSKPRTFRSSFARENLSMSVFNVPLKEQKLLQVVTNVAGSGIVYVKTRRRAIEVAEFLQHNKITAAYYHGGLSNQERFDKQQSWVENKTRVMVATNAFGMGINKPDVRFVVHVDMSFNLEAYYQEAGRAGRDGLKAFAVALFNENELDLMEVSVEQKYVPVDFLRKCYQALCNYYRLAEGIETTESYSFDLHDFVSRFGMNAIEVHNALKLLEHQAVLTLSDSYYSPSKLQITSSATDLYDFYLKSPNAEKFIKTLLRMYGGELYNGFVRIAESEIGKAAFMSEFDVRKRLNELTQSGIMDYQRQRNSPQILFLTKRYDANLLPINSREIEIKKATDLKSVRAVIDYLLSSMKCRMLQLQEYFDDNQGIPCGICDNCLSKNKSLQSNELIAYKEKLLDIVPVKADNLRKNPFFTDVMKLKLAISHLLENELLTISELGVLEKK